MKKSFLQRVVWLMIPLLTIFTTNVWGAVKTGWTRVTQVSEITSGGTFIFGNEATPNSNVIIPMTIKVTSTPSGNGYAYSGTKTTSNTTTIDMGNNSTVTTDYEYSVVAGSASGKVCIVVMDGTYKNYYFSFSGTSNGNMRVANTKSNYTDFTPTIGSNNVVSFTNVKYNTRGLRFNTGNSPRFTNYGSAAQGGFVMYKKASSCDKSVGVTKGSESHGEVTTIGSASVATCSSTESDRRVTITITPDDCYDAPSSLTWTKSSGTVTASKQSGPTDNGDGTYSYVYQFAQNDNGAGTFGVTCTAKAAGKTVNFDAGPGVSASSSLTETCDGSGVTLPSVTASGVCKGWTTFAGWATAPVTDSTTTSGVTLYAAGDNFVPSSNGQTLYAVYSKAKGGGGGETKQVELDLTSNTNWQFPAGSSNKVYSTTENSYTSGDYTIKVAGDGNSSNGYYYNSNGYFLIGKSGAYIKLPAFSFTTSKIVVVGNSGASANTKQNIYVGSTAVSTETTSSASTQTYEINSNYQAAGNIYQFQVTSGHNAQVTKIEVYSPASITYYCSDPDCCTDWSTPAVSYSSSLAINASEGVTIGDGTTHGAVTYESSDEDVLTVEADGTIHAVGAGTAHIIATWAGDATYCEKSANSNDVTVSGIQVTGTTPVNFGQVYQNAVIGDKTLSVTGLGLTSNIIPSLPAGSPFSFSPASLAKDCSGATLTISASTATLGTYNQTLTLTSGAFSATVTVKMEVIAKPTATFTDALHELTTDKNGASLNSFNLEAAQGTPVVFPTLANQTKSAGTCEGEYYIFAGWTEGDNNTDPEAHLVTSHTLANGDAKHYYAVWADASGSATYTKLTSNSFSTSAHYVIGAESGGTDYFLYSCEKTDANNSWGLVSSDPATDAPIQFTLSGTASALVAASTEATTRYLKAASGKQFFGMSSSSTTVVLGSGGTIESTADTYNNLRYNSAGGLRWYTGTTTGDAAYFYEVGSSGTVHYRTSCCANKVDAPVVTATTVTSTSITLTWPADVKATGWEVSWNGGAFGAPSGTCTHTVSGLTPNTTYTWKVRATYNAPQCGADTRSGSTTTHQVYHVTYAKGSGTGSCTASGSTTDETGYEAGATVTLQTNDFTLSGNTFAAWTTDDPDVVISSNQFTMPDHDVVITATWTAKADKYFDRMHDQTDASHGGVAETEGTNEGKYYILKEGCSYSVPTAVDSKTGDACQTSHYKLRGWIAASYVNSKGEITDESKIFSPGTTKTAGGYTYYAVWAEVVE